MIDNDVINFLKENKEYYPEYFINNRLSKVKYGYTCDINQIYCYLNKIPIKNTDYYKLVQIINDHFNLKNMNILEVACGYIPILSGIIKENYNTKNTAINNKILINNYKNVNTIEFDLFKPFNLSDYDLIIGFRPCAITENIILECFYYKKDFLIYLCPCDNKPLNKHNYNPKTWTYKKWHNYIISLIKNNRNYIIKIIKNHELEDDCPIIIAKYKR